MQCARRIQTFFIVAVVAVSAWMAAGAAATAAPYAAMVVDMRTGEVVYEHDADRRQHPASLTKLMTLYLTFEALENGQISLDQKVRVSRHAARQPASKLYLKAGQRVTIRHLIRAAAIKSANDAAMVLAEAIGGSERNFGKLMTRKARALGMTRTHFYNPHGLTQKGHLSTARDMVKLGRALYFHFPQYYNVFGRTHAYAAGKRVNTTNRLLHTYRGAEGMKTGYTRAAGFNLLATAKRDSRRVMAVILGGDSSRWRNARMAELLNRGFRTVPAYAAEIPPSVGRGTIMLAEAPLPQPRPGTAATGFGAFAAAIASPATASTRDPATDFAPLYAELPRERASDEGPARRRAARLPAPEIPLPEARPGWAVQLAAFRDRAAAEATLSAIDRSNLPELATGVPSVVAERARSGRMMYKVRVLGLEEGAARAACRKARSRGEDCLAVAPR